MTIEPHSKKTIRGFTATNEGQSGSSLTVFPNAVGAKPAKRGFTLLELLVVVSIIGLLATVILNSVNIARAKARDAERVKTLQELRKAIELYYSDNGYYPPLIGTTDAVSRSTGATCIDNKIGDAEWCELIDAIKNYHKGGIDDPLTTGSFSYYYDSDGAAPLSYGLMVILESTAVGGIYDADGGYYCQAGCVSTGQSGLEYGTAPSLCAANGGLNWRTPGC